MCRIRWRSGWRTRTAYSQQSNQCKICNAELLQRSDVAEKGSKVERTEMQEKMLLNQITKDRERNVEKKERDVYTE